MSAHLDEQQIVPHATPKYPAPITLTLTVTLTVTLTLTLSLTLTLTTGRALHMAACEPIESSYSSPAGSPG